MVEWAAAGEDGAVSAAHWCESDDVVRLARGEHGAEPNKCRPGSPSS